MSSSVLGAADIHRIETEEPVVCLTFDDGPLTEHALCLQKLLDARGAKGTFFVNSMKIPAGKEALLSLYEAGHEIGNHTANHPSLPGFEDTESIRREIMDCQTAVKAVIGEMPEVFRAPYLSQDARVRKILDEAGMPSIFCSTDTRDWDAETPAETILQRAIDGLEPGAVILMHEFRDETAEILPALLDAIEARGLKAVTVSEALKLSR